MTELHVTLKGHMMQLQQKECLCIRHRIYSVCQQKALRDRVKGQITLNSRVGHVTNFTLEEEALTQLFHMAEIGYGYTKMSIQRMTKEYVHSLTKQL